MQQHIQIAELNDVNTRFISFEIAKMLVFDLFVFMSLKFIVPHYWG